MSGGYTGQGAGHTWQRGWSEEQKRYYYYDRSTGKSYWLKPKDCPLPDTNDNIAPRKPGEGMPVLMPTDLPDGWKAVLDEVTCSPPKFYYYNTTTNERTWFKPQLTAAEKAQRQEDARKRLTEIKKKKVPTSRTDTLRHLIWSSDNFKICLEEARGARETTFLRKLMRDVYDNNVSLIGREIAGKGNTCSVSFDDCERALKNGTVQDYGTDPQVSFSSRSVSEAMLHFASQDPRRVVCGLHVANGPELSKGYIGGELTEEDDLFRRIPGLYHALEHAESQQDKFPFGPDSNDPKKYSDVLFTDGVKLMRSREEDGFAILADSEQVNISIVSSAPPTAVTDGIEEWAAGAGGYAELEAKIGAAVASVFVGPVLRDARTTTLILSAWGAQPGKPHVTEALAHLFAKAIVGEVRDLQTRLGRLYHEIHFAILPVVASDTDDPGAAHNQEDAAVIYRRVFGESRYAIRFVDMGV